MKTKMKLRGLKPAVSKSGILEAAHNSIRTLKGAVFMSRERINSDIKKMRLKMLPIFKEHGVVKAGIFGSVARGEASKDSDVDILVGFKGKKSLLDLARLELALEKKSGKNGSFYI